MFQSMMLVGKFSAGSSGFRIYDTVGSKGQMSNYKIQFATNMDSNSLWKNS